MIRCHCRLRVRDVSASEEQNVDQTPNDEFDTQPRTAEGETAIKHQPDATNSSDDSADGTMPRSLMVAVLDHSSICARATSGNETRKSDPKPIDTQQPKTIAGSPVRSARHRLTFLIHRLGPFT